MRPPRRIQELRAGLVVEEERLRRLVGQAIADFSMIAAGDSLYIRSHRPDGVPVEVKAQAVRVTPANYGTSRVGVAIIEPKDGWLRLFVAWIADDNVVEGIDE